jgi:hypothetical protein
VDEGYDLQIWRLIANTLNKQTWASNKKLSSTLEVGQDASSPQNVTQDLGRALVNIVMNLQVP